MVPVIDTLKVLFLEDSPADAHLAVRQLSIAGFKPDYRITSSRNEFERALEWGPDIILLDYNVPGFDGPAALELVQQLGLDAPVIVVSGSVDEEAIAATMKAGARDYLQKDRLTRLGTAISSAMREWRLQRELAVAAERSENAARLHTIFESLTDAMLTLGPGLRIESANPAAMRIFAAAGELLHSGAERWVRSPSGAPAKLDLSKASTPAKWIEGRGVRSDGGTFAAEWCLTSLGEGSAILVVRDISRRKASMAALHEKAVTDPLTKLRNRSLFLDRAEQAVAESRRSGTMRALFMLDLNGFKEVNDSLGHAAGDAVLQEVARRLKHSVRASDTVARLGGDEFGVLLAGSTGEGQAMVVAQKLDATLRLPIDVEGQAATVSGSIGLALFPDDGQSIEELLAHADAGMFFAKRNGLGICRLKVGSHRERRQGEVR